MNRSKVLAVLAVLAVAALSLTLGVYIGKGEGIKQAEQKLSPLIHAIYPKPPDEIKSLGGTIRDFVGSSMNLEVYDPDDYLPHVDGSDRRKEIRMANVLSSTKISLLNYSKMDSRGNPLITTLKLSDLKVGDAVTVRSNLNIKYLKEFDASEILLVK